MNICRITGSTERAVAPRWRSSVGTSRQPRNRWPSSTTIVWNSVDLVALEIVARQEREAGAVLRRGRQHDAEARARLAEELVGHLQEDAGAVAGVGLAPAGAAVKEVDEDLQRLAHDGVRLSPLDVDDETDAAGVVLVARIVETLSGWWSELARLHYGHSIAL